MLWYFDHYTGSFWKLSEEKLEAGRYTEFEERFLLPAIQARSKDNYKMQSLNFFPVFFHSTFHFLIVEILSIKDSTSFLFFHSTFHFLIAETSKLVRESGFEPN